MSGVTGTGRYELVATKALYWHRRRTECECRDLRAVASVHLLPAGFVVEAGSSLGYVVVGGPGLASADTGPMYAATSERGS